MSRLSIVASVLLLLPGPAPASENAEGIDLAFRSTVRPFLESFCISCHGHEKPKGGLDLDIFSTSQSVADDLARWGLVQEQIDLETMPPRKAPRHPSDQARTEVLAWIDSVRKREASRSAGDPGRVLARRLSNAEYDYTIRDLTGVDLQPTREFPVDPANEAGFDNSSESLVMSPALVKKYLDAARKISDHLVLTPTGIRFAPYPMLADTDHDKYCVQQIINFYNGQRTDLADYFLAAWRFRHRAALGRPGISLEALASEAGLSSKYLDTIWAILTDQGERVGPIALVQSLWLDLPEPHAASTSAARVGCERLRDVIVDLRRQLVPEVPNMTARGVSSGSQPFVLWKNREVARNRMLYAGGGSKVRSTLLPSSLQTALWPPEGEAFDQFEKGFERFCHTFPDAFFVSERARVYLDPNQEKNNTGRLLSAGFHSMTGYFRDDGPLYELMLDADGQRDLDRLWREFDFITGAPMRQYSSYLWYERAESGFLRGPEFNSVRAEDRDAGSPSKIAELSKIYLAKARDIGVHDGALKAIEDQFLIISQQIQRVQQDRLAAEPLHIRALQEFAQRAYRRPLTDQERRDISEFYRILRQDDDLDHEDAVRDSVVGILMSPHFLYRFDRPTRERGVQPLSDYDLASRLSYFLWASMPDSELLDHAASGDLHDPDVLVSQTRRMLQDDRALGLATEFAGHWLDFRRFEQHNSVDRQRFPSFDDDLRRSMFQEPIHFFLDVVQNDRSILNFLEARHTFVNRALARHYGMPTPSGEPQEWVRIDDATPYGRGGLLPMAVFLTQNSPGLRTSPVKRGYWVVKRLLGENIPAPPANVPDLPDDESKLGEQTLRDALALHRDNESCAGCHQRFDGIGLAFEGYGPVGESRTLDLGGRPVDTRAEFPGGEEGDGIAGLRTYLESRRRAEFVDNLCRKLLAYALGRSLIASDDPTVENLKTKLESDGFRFGSLVESIVLSPQFRNKRVDALSSEPSR